MKKEKIFYKTYWKYLTRRLIELDFLTKIAVLYIISNT